MKINVAVIFGGESVEHEVSVISALQAMDALDQERYEVVPIYISKKRQLYSDASLRNIETYKDLNKLVETTDQVTMYKSHQQVFIEPIKKGLFSKSKKTQIDIAIPVIHGTNGEDGTIQGYLQMMNIPFSGCDVIAAGVGQDKVIMKHVLENSNIPMTKWTWVYGHEIEKEKQRVLEEVSKIGYPVIIKPACLGSSVGIEVAFNEKELILAIKSANQYDEKIVIEKMIENLKEINCSVLGDVYSCRASVLEEVAKADKILSYHDKYEGNGKSKGMVSAKRIIPASIDEASTLNIQDLAVRTFKILGASGVCRIDFMIDEDTNEVFVNEINTIPGSLAFYLWKESNVDFPMLMQSLVDQAIARQRRHEKMVFSYDTNILKDFKSGGSKGAKGKLS